MLARFLTWLFGYRTWWLTMPSCLVEISIPAWWKYAFSDAMRKRIEKDFMRDGYSIYPEQVMVRVHSLKDSEMTRLR